MDPAFRSHRILTSFLNLRKTTSRLGKRSEDRTTGIPTCRSPLSITLIRPHSSHSKWPPTSLLVAVPCLKRTQIQCVLVLMAYRRPQPQSTQSLLAIGRRFQSLCCRPYYSKHPKTSLESSAFPRSKQPLTPNSPIAVLAISIGTIHSLIRSVP